jgi:hypothetical protein
MKQELKAADARLENHLTQKDKKTGAKTKTFVQGL